MPNNRISSENEPAPPSDSSKSPAPRTPSWMPAVLSVLDLALLAALLILPLVWLCDQIKLDLQVARISIRWNWKPVLMPVLLFAARSLAVLWFRRRGLAPAGLFERLWFKRLLLALVSTYICVSMAQGLLILTDFKAEIPPAIVIVDNSGDGSLARNETLPDPELIYRLKPGSVFAGRRVNAIGFLGREVNPIKQPATIRVICMGDSVTAQGRPCYAQYLHERLTNQPTTTERWEAFNMGIHAYSSLQGLALFKKQGRSMNPDIVSLYYGWNDHWLADKTDRQQMGLSMTPGAARLFNVLRKKRVFMFLVWSLNPVLHMARIGESPNNLDYRNMQDAFHGRKLRVSHEEYRATLTAFVAAIRQAGAVPLLITAPRSSIAPANVHKRHIRSVEEGNRLHDQYVEITREVARQTRAPLLDLASIMTTPENLRYFAEDGIHFDLYSYEPTMEGDADPERQPGLRRIAAELDSKIREIVQSPEWQKRN